MNGTGSFPSLHAGREGAAKAAEGWGFAEMALPPYSHRRRDALYCRYSSPNFLSR